MIDAAKLEPLLLRVAQWTFTSSARARFYRKLSTYVANGVPTHAALQELAKQSRKTEGGKSLEGILLEHLIRRIENGHPFHRAISFVSPDEQMLIEAGETGARLPESLEDAANVVERKQQIIGGIAKAMAMPALLTVMTIVMVYILCQRVVPAFLQIMPASSWTGSSRVMLDLYEVTESPYGALLLIVPILALTGVLVSLPRWTSRVRKYFDRLPPWSFYKFMVGGCWLISTSALIGAGVPVAQVLDKQIQSAERSSPWLYAILIDVRNQFRTGLSLGPALHASGYEFPNREIITDMCVYDRYPHFEENLRKLANQSIEKGVKGTQKQAAMLNTCSMIVVILAVASFALSLGDLTKSFMM